MRGCHQHSLGVTGRDEKRGASGGGEEMGEEGDWVVDNGEDWVGEV